MLKSIKILHKGLAVNKMTLFGFLLTYGSIVLFVLYELFKLIGLFQNAALGLFLYMLFPGLFVLGVILVLGGWAHFKKSQKDATDELLERQYHTDFIKPKLYGSRFIQFFTLFTVFLVIVFSAMTFRMLHFMEDSHFCGTACHDVMNPEWQTYQHSAHAHVECVDCHVGEGVSGFLQAKMDGTRQLVMMLFDTYKRPIPAPVHQMRPAREVCEKCHWPEKFYGQRLVTRVKHAMDSLSTPRYTTLNVKVDVGVNNRIPGAHWHIGAENKVVYTSVDRERLKMINVRAKQADGVFKEWKNSALLHSDEEEERVLDCIDCHNRATHVYRNPEKLVDEMLLSGEIVRSMPYAKQQALAAITSGYPSQAEGITGIKTALNGFYINNYPAWYEENKSDLDRAVAALQEAYATNIHQYMDIDWGAYPNHIGHERNLGCFRCHNSNLVADDGSEIDHGCTLCHSILASDSDDPYQYLKAIDYNTPEASMHEYLQKEFFEKIY